MNSIAFSPMPKLPAAFPELEHKSHAKKQPTKFLKALHAILDNNMHQSWIRWSDNGKQIIVLDSSYFSENVLPTYFKHNNYSTFVRQLNIYGFRKGKQDGCDIFAHPMFTRGRPDLLRYVSRNQKKKLAQSSSNGSSESKSCSESVGDFKYDALSEVLLSEIKALQEQQAELDTRLKVLNYQNEAHDFSFQMTINRFYRREQDEKIGSFIILMLNQYLTKDSRQIALEEVSMLNNALKTWISASAPLGKKKCYHHEHSANRCYVVYKFFAMYNLRCNKLTEEGKQSLEMASSNFISWVRGFLQRNGIYFPHLDILFLRLIYCVIPMQGHMLEESEESIEESESAEYVTRVKGLLEETLKASENSSKCGEDTVTREGDHEIDIIHDVMELNGVALGI